MNLYKNSCVYTQKNQIKYFNSYAYTSKKFQLFNKFRLSISNSFANDTDDEQEGKTPRH